MDIQSLDLDQFRLKQESNVQPVKKQRLRQESNAQPAKKQPPPRHKVGEWFLMRIPGYWLNRLCSLRSIQAIKTGVALWYLAGMLDNRTVTLTKDAKKKFNLSSDAARHGLDALEQAGLVIVNRVSGRSHVVTILEVEKESETAVMDD